MLTRPEDPDSNASSTSGPLSPPVPRGTAPKLWSSSPPRIRLLFCFEAAPRKLKSPTPSGSAFTVGVSNANVCHRRPFTGRLSISSEVTVLATAALDTSSMLTVAGASGVAVTVTAVTTPPTCSRASTEVTPPTSTTTPSSVSGANCAYSTTTWYLPAGTRATRNSPLPPDFVSITRPVEVSRTCTAAPASAAPLASTTKPLIAPSTAVCPHVRRVLPATPHPNSRQITTIFRSKTIAPTLTRPQQNNMPSPLETCTALHRNHGKIETELVNALNLKGKASHPQRPRFFAEGNIGD